MTVDLVGDTVRGMSPEQAMRIVEELWPTDSPVQLLDTRADIEKSITADLPREQVGMRTAVMAALARAAVTRGFADAHDFDVVEGGTDRVLEQWDEANGWRQAVFQAAQKARKDR